MAFAIRSGAPSPFVDLLFCGTLWSQSWPSTNLRLCSITLEVVHCNSSFEFQLRILGSLWHVVEVPCVLEADIKSPRKYCPPPFFAPYGYMISVGILIHEVCASHKLIIFSNKSWPFHRDGLFLWSRVSVDARQRIYTVYCWSYEATVTGALSCQRAINMLS